MPEKDRRDAPGGDRRRFPRGGRRAADRPGRHPPVVIADTYRDARIPCVQYLARLGFDVVETASARRTLAAIAAARPHVVIADDALPHLSSHQLSARLARDDRTRGIPLIVMSTGFEEAATRAGAHADGVLLKPFRLAKMLAEIRRVLRLKPQPAAGA